MPAQFSAPWDYTISTPNAADAWKKLKAEIEADSTLKIVEADDKKFYLRAEGTSKVPSTGIDDVEFLLVPDQKILTYRSASRENVYVCELNPLPSLPAPLRRVGRRCLHLCFPGAPSHPPPFLPRSVPGSCAGRRFPKKEGRRDP